VTKPGESGKRVAGQGKSKKKVRDWDMVGSLWQEEVHIRFQQTKGRKSVKIATPRKEEIGYHVPEGGEKALVLTRKQ